MSTEKPKIPPQPENLDSPSLLSRLDPRTGEQRMEGRATALSETRSREALDTAADARVQKIMGMDWNKVATTSLNRLLQAEDENLETKGLMGRLFCKSEKTHSQLLFRDQIKPEEMSTEFAPGTKISVDFQGNNAAEWNIGAGDLLPPSVKTIKVLSARDGTERTGERASRPRVGYYDGSGYIPVFTGDIIEIVELETDTEKLTRIEQEETVSHTARREELRETQRRISEILAKAGISNLDSALDGSADASKIKEAFQSFSGEEIWQIRNMLGPQNLGVLFKNAGLLGEKVNLSAIISKNVHIRALADQLPHHMLEKVMQIESGSRIFAVSPTGALGCMQLTKYVYLDPSPINPFKPEEAVERAASHLLSLYKQYGESGAVRAYNQGTGNMHNSAAREYERLYSAA